MPDPLRTIRCATSQTYYCSNHLYKVTKHNAPIVFDVHSRVLHEKQLLVAEREPERRPSNYI
jgi:hypothetical protein